MKFLHWMVVLSLVGLTACATKPPKNTTILRLNLPANPALAANRRMPVVLRMPSISLQVDVLPVLTEQDLDHAELTGEGDNFGMKLYFNTHGTIVLDSVSLSNRGQILVVFINGVPVAAPMLRQRIVDGTFEFTPDLTRDVAEKVVAGLNATVEYIRKSSHH